MREEEEEGAVEVMDARPSSVTESALDRNTGSSSRSLQLLASARLVARLLCQGHQRNGASALLLLLPVVAALIRGASVASGIMTRSSALTGQGAVLSATSKS